MLTGASTILVVEDDALIRHLLGRLLLVKGYRVESFENGKRALDFLTTCTELPSLILLDLMMPVMNGREFLAQIRENPGDPLYRIPIIVLTAADGVLESIEKEVFAVARKPLDLDPFFELVEKALHENHRSLIFHE